MPPRQMCEMACLLLALVVYPERCSPALQKSFVIQRLRGGVQYYEGMRDERGRSKSRSGKPKFLNATMINEECRQWLEEQHRARRHASFAKFREECAPRSKSAPHESQFRSNSPFPVPTGSNLNKNVSLFQSRVWSTEESAGPAPNLNWSHITSQTTFRSSSSEEWLKSRLRGGKPQVKSSMKEKNSCAQSEPSPASGKSQGLAPNVEEALKVLESCDASRPDITSREAIAQLEGLCERGNGRAGFNLAQIYEKGNYGVLADTSKSVEFLHSSALNDYPPAMYHLGIRYLSGKGVAANKTRAIEWWRKAARLGHEKSQMRLGVYMLDQGQKASDPIEGAAMIEEAIALLQMAGTQGLSDANYVLGAYLLAISKRSAQRKEALSLIQAAADAGHVLGSAVMGRVLLKGDNCIESDEVKDSARTVLRLTIHSVCQTKAAKYLEKAAIGGDADSQYLYGCLFMDGFRREVEESTPAGLKRKDTRSAESLVHERDPAVAFEWFRKAAESGSAEAQYKVAMRQLEKYRSSNLQSAEKAKAAQAGHIEAAWQMAHQLIDLARSLKSKVSRQILAEAGQWVKV
eukprot:764027-Hanusia_phi.AAC.14